MNTKEIQKALKEGKSVCWASRKYEVLEENGDLFIRSTWNMKKTKVLRNDNVTMNVNEALFFINKT